MSNNKGKILVRGIQCPRCNERVYSRHNHDFRYCGCGYCFIDGGQTDYMRIGWGVGLPDGMENDGTVPMEVWEKVNAETAAIGKPETIRFYIKGVRLKKQSTISDMISLAAYLELEKTDERKKQQRNRTEAGSKRVGTRGNKPTNKRTTRPKRKA